MEDSSLAGAATAASAGLSAGLASFSCAHNPLLIMPMSRMSASNGMIFFTRIISSLLKKLGFRGSAKLRFYPFVRSSGLFCSTAQEQILFTGPHGFHKEFGTIIDDPVRSRFLEFRVTGRSS